MGPVKLIGEDFFFGAAFGALAGFLQIQRRPEPRVVGMVAIAAALIGLTLIRNQQIISALVGG